MVTLPVLITFTVYLLLVPAYLTKRINNMGTLDPPAPPPPPPSPPEVVASNHHHDVHNHDDLPPNYHQQQQPPTAETPEEVASEGCLPQAYLTLPFDDVKELIRQDLASLCDKKLNPKVGR